MAKISKQQTQDLTAHQTSVKIYYHSHAGVSILAVQTNNGVYKAIWQIP